MQKQGLLPETLTFEQAKKNYIKAANKGDHQGRVEDGHLDGAELPRRPDLRGDRPRQGRDRPVLHRHRQSRINGVGLDVIAPRVARAAPPAASRRSRSNGEVLENGGQYQWRRDGEYHMWNPDTVAKLQQAVRITGLPDVQGVHQARRRRGPAPLHDPRAAATSRRRATPVPIEEVEPAKEIVKRFVTGAMSFGSISKEAHENLAIAMNRIGGKSNTGEGGEDPDRFKPDADGTCAPQRDQAGRQRPVRRDDRVPRQRRRAPDQDGPGRQARRGRAAARPQGRRVHRQDPPQHARRRADLAAAAPRHLLDRGPGAAHPRPEERRTRRRA